MKHYIEYYSCGKHVMQQCRCPDKNKAKIVSKVKCPQCRRDPDTIDMFDGKTDRERRDPRIICPGCGSTAFVDKKGRIVAHFDNGGNKCKANGTKRG